MNLTIKHHGIILAGLIAAYFHIILFPDIAFTLNGLWGLAGYMLLAIALWAIMGNKQFMVLS